MNREQVAALFHQVFGAGADYIVLSPGRINIIGEHTDYNDGFVLPAAIDKAITLGIRKRDDQQILLYAEEFSENFSVGLADIKPLQKWTDYILGVADQYVQRGYKIGGFELLLTGNVPIGAGLSSSAAVECAVAFALNEVFGHGIAKMDLVHMARMAEHEFAGVKCGIMDQFASMFGKKDHLIRLDCRSLEYEYVPIEMKDIQLVLFNTNVKHSLASSAYNTRRQECEEGVRLVKEKYPEVNSLRDVTKPMLEEMVLPVNHLVYRRSLFVVSEIERLLSACEDLKQGNIQALGKRMLETHDGLSKDYEVSCDELDFLVENVRNNPDVLGARMVGGGFGGCTINLVRKDKIDELSANLAEIYKKSMGKELSTYLVSAEDGTHLL